MAGMSWWAWIVVAGVLALAEMGVPGAYLMWIALGAAVTALVDAAFGLSLEGQLGTFAAASAVSCGVGFFVYRRLQLYGHADAPINDPRRALLGARGTVCEALVNGRGRVRIGDAVWLAAGPDLAEGEAVVVSGLRGTRLVVEAVAPNPPAASAGVPM
jgi:inner membrane protein